MTHEKILASLRSEINEQTAQMRWSELERFFASGTVISIAPELDLVDVGARIAADDKQSVAALTPQTPQRPTSLLVTTLI